MNSPQYTIGQVSEMTGLAPHVLRFWESVFDRLRPMRSETGSRVYSPEDVAMILRIKRLLHEERYTIEGAKKVLEREAKEGPLVTIPQRELLALRAFLMELLRKLDR